MRQPVQGEAPPVAFFFEHEQDRLTAAVGPLHEQRHIQLPKVFAQTFLQLFLSRRDDAHRVIRGGRLCRGEKRQRIARIVENQVLEVLVVADRVRHAPRPLVVLPQDHANAGGRATGNR